MEAILTTAETGQELDLTPAMVRHLERTGKLSALKTKNGTRIFLAQDVEKLKRLRAQRKKTEGK